MAADLWDCIKLGIGDQKLGDLHDLDFDAQEPAVHRSIRVHSVSKKALESTPGPRLVMEPPRRFPSCAKKEGLPSPKPLMRTTLGFKRLGLPRQQNNYEHLLELPDKLELSELQIRLSEGIGRNLERARQLGDLLGRWADYQKKLAEGGDHAKVGCLSRRPAGATEPPCTASTTPDSAARTTPPSWPACRRSWCWTTP